MIPGCVQEMAVLDLLISMLDGGNDDVQSECFTCLNRLEARRFFENIKKLIDQGQHDLEVLSTLCIIA